MGICLKWSNRGLMVLGLVASAMVPLLAYSATSPQDAKVKSDAIAAPPSVKAPLSPISPATLSAPTPAFTFRAPSPAEEFPDSPESAILQDPETGLSPEFCAEWNPEFGRRGGSCCPAPYVKAKGKGRKASFGQCGKARRKTSYCDEMTVEQRIFVNGIRDGIMAAEPNSSFKGPQGNRPKDVLELLMESFEKRQAQAFCGVANGFLADGKPVIATPQNRLFLKNPGRCVNFGTDGAVGMLEWVGREVAREFPAPEYVSTRLLIGDLSAPRGGCLVGQWGTRSHSSHTSGEDIDLSFLAIVKGNRVPSSVFPTTFDPKANLWLLKKFFSNPFVGIKSVFLDKRHIRKLNKIGARDPEWLKIRGRVQHIRGHMHHFHIRVCSDFSDPKCVTLNPNVEKLRLPPALDSDDELDDPSELEDFSEPVEHTGG